MFMKVIGLVFNYTEEGLKDGEIEEELYVNPQFTHVIYDKADKEGWCVIESYFNSSVIVKGKAEDIQKVISEHLSNIRNDYESKGNQE